MSWWIWLPFLAVLLFLLPLIPRVSLSGAGGPGGISLLLKGPGYRLAFDSRNMEIEARYLLFRFKPLKIATDGAEMVGKIWREMRRKAPPPKSTVEQAKPQAEVVREPRRTRRQDVGLAIDLVKHFIQFMKRVLRSVRMDYLRADITVASPDPMGTAMIFGALQPLWAFNSERRTFRVMADFETERPRVEAEWSFSIRPIITLWILVTWGAWLPWRRIWRAVRAN